MKTKTSILLLLVFAATYSLQAQTEKGKWMIGATTNNFGLIASKGVTGLGLQLSPNVGYFVANNLAIGARLGFSYSNSTQNGASTGRSSGISGSAFGRYYIPITDRLKIPIDLQAGYTYGKGYSGRNRFESSSIYGNIASGLSFFPAKNVSIDLLAGYGLQKFFNRSGQGPNGRLNAQIGFSIFLDGKKGQE